MIDGYKTNAVCFVIKKKFELRYKFEKKRKWNEIKFVGIQHAEICFDYPEELILVYSKIVNCEWEIEGDRVRAKERWRKRW